MTRFFYYLDCLCVVVSIATHLEHKSVSQNFILLAFLGFERRSTTARVDDQLTAKDGHEMIWFFALNDTDLNSATTEFVIQFNCHNCSMSFFILARSRALICKRKGLFT